MPTFRVSPPSGRQDAHILDPDTQVAQVCAVLGNALQLPGAALQDRKQLCLVASRFECVLSPLDESAKKKPQQSGVGMPSTNNMRLKAASPQPKLQGIVALVLLYLCQQLPVLPDGLPMSRLRLTQHARPLFYIWHPPPMLLSTAFGLRGRLHALQDPWITASFQRLKVFLGILPVLLHARLM